MPSAKSRAAKAAIAARVAEYEAANAAAAALAAANGGADMPTTPNGVAAGKPNPSGITPFGVAAVNGMNGANVNRMMTTQATLLKPTLPSMLVLNTSPNLNRALSVGAVVANAKGPTQAGEAGVGHNASDEENVQPLAAPGAAQVSASDYFTAGEEFGLAAAAAATAKARPMSPLSSPALGGKERDVRAYEVERQRMKRAGELAKRKAKKAAHVVATVVGHSHSRVSSESALGEGGRKARDAMDVDIEEMKLGSAGGLKKSGPGGVGLADWKGFGSVKEKVKIASGGGGGVEVSLSELVVTSHRKPRKVKEDDFEFIPPVRAVIVLDDMLEARDMDIDEPWEHIESDVEQGMSDKAGPSYAAILAARGL